MPGQMGGRQSTIQNNHDGNEWTNKTNPVNLKSNLDDAIFDIGPVTTKAHEYHNNLKLLLSHIQQMFKGSDDIVKSIKEKQHVDFD